MSTETTLKSFLNQVKDTQTLWALQDKNSEDWVVLDSVNFENTEVMPLWSTEALAISHCVEEWADYKPAAIKIADWMEFWVEDLLEDGVIIGLDWQENEACFELELAEFTQALAEVETL
ncbi:DUF2750 domain-containing protein [Cognaticolwellia beringensis]|uniref:DUF2750 domain-containing protein n=1 Tax=Cognaticolwellia beringensis TaxID=1967665 RepID=A0A222G686_9GAMM|nr:DUF2750 domain-containing protein [Cognaticolwellia beringensis]ASP47321.1 DUF2750 domain-containing protein [Cognaticolwellia beringensis]|tara:strand:+ start:11439 stop:11795 length:357 start_codon:yes stop_codon:yes gene_type:complete